MVMTNAKFALWIEAIDTRNSNHQPERPVLIKQLEPPARLASDFPDERAKNLKCVFGHVDSRGELFCAALRNNSIHVVVLSLETFRLHTFSVRQGLDLFGFMRAIELAIQADDVEVVLFQRGRGYIDTFLVRKHLKLIDCQIIQAIGFRLLFLYDFRRSYHNGVTAAFPLIEERAQLKTQELGGRGVDRALERGEIRTAAQHSAGGSAMICGVTNENAKLRHEEN